MSLLAMLKPGRIGMLFLHAISWLAVTYMVVPLAVIVAASFNDSNRLAFPPQGFSLKWYTQFLSDPTYVQSILNSTQLAVSATAIALVLGTMAALAIARGNFRGAGALTTFMMSPLVLPNIVIGAALLQFASMFGFARSFSSLLAGHVILVMPYVIRLVLASFAGFNRSLEEASQDLGAGPVATFFRVTLPQIKPGIVSGGLFAFVVSWVNVELSIFNSSPQFALLPVKILNYVEYTVDPLIAAVSASTIYVAIVIVLLIDAFIGIDKFANARAQT